MQFIPVLRGALDHLFRGSQPQIPPALVLPGPARPLHSNSVEHGDQQGLRAAARPAGPPPPEENDA